MGNMRRRLRRLEEAADANTMTLVCPECGAVFTLYGDPALEFIVRSWTQGYEGETHGPPTDPAILELAAHEHDASSFVDKATGEPWLGEFFAGTLGLLDDDVPDLSEP